MLLFEVPMAGRPLRRARISRALNNPATAVRIVALECSGWDIGEIPATFYTPGILEARKDLDGGYVWHRIRFINTKDGDFQEYPTWGAIPDYGYGDRPVEYPVPDPDAVEAAKKAATDLGIDYVSGIVQDGDVVPAHMLFSQNNPKMAERRQFNLR